MRKWNRGAHFAMSAKRAADVVGAAAGLVLGAPLLALDGRPNLFHHRRPGLHGKPFTMLKFRTMRLTRPGEVPYHTDEERMTRLGRLLRATSIDELPELWNVLRGEMSLVGPRPLLTEYLDKYTPREARRHDVLPGITGWAAVNGRHTRKFKERLELDVWYVENWSLGLDLKILAMTVTQVLRRSSVATSQGIEELGFPLPLPERQNGAASVKLTGR